MNGLRYESRVLALALAAFFVTLFSRLVIGPVVPEITDSLSVSKSQIGMALTGMWAATALVQYPGGVLGDRHGERNVILVALGLTGLGCLLLAVSPNFLLFAGFVVLVGLGSGLYVPASTALLTKTFDNTGRALGFHIAGGNIAGIAAPITGTMLAVRYGWRAAPLVVALFCVPVYLLFSRHVRFTEGVRAGESMRSLFDPRRGLEILLRPPILFSTLLGTIGAFAFQAITSFLPTFLVEHWAFSVTGAGMLFGVVFALSVTCLPIVGSLSDRIGRDRAFLLSFALLSSGIAILVFGPDPWFVYPGIVVVGAGISWGGVLQSRYMDHLLDDERGTGFGTIRTATGLLGSLGSVVTGVVADLWSWPHAFGVVLALLAIAIVLLLVNHLFELDL